MVVNASFCVVRLLSYTVHRNLIESEAAEEFFRNVHYISLYTQCFLHSKSFVLFFKNGAKICCLFFVCKFKMEFNKTLMLTDGWGDNRNCKLEAVVVIVHCSLSVINYNIPLFFTSANAYFPSTMLSAVQQAYFDYRSLRQAYFDSAYFD